MSCQLSIRIVLLKTYNLNSHNDRKPGITYHFGAVALTLLDLDITLYDHIAVAKCVNLRI